MPLKLDPQKDWIPYYVRVFYNITISIELDKKSLTKDEIGIIIMSNRLDKET